MTEDPPLTHREILIRVQTLCRSFGRNMAYYRAGWAMLRPGVWERPQELQHLFETNPDSKYFNPDSGNFWATVSNNFLDMCVLDWCKLFGERDGNYSWKRIFTDPDAFN